MARKTYETQLILGAKVHSSFGKGFNQAQKNLKNLQYQAKANERAFGGMSNMIRKAAGVAAGYFSARAILNFARASTEAAQQEIEARTKLTEVMRAMMGASDEQIESIVRLTTEQEKLGVVSRDVQIAGAQQMSTYLRQKETLDILVPAINDLLVQTKGVNATQQDAVNIANMYGKAFIGMPGLLRRAGIVFNKAEERVLKYGNELEKASMLAQVIYQNVGKMNEAMAQSDPGKIKQLENILRSTRIEIGKKLLPVQAKWAEIQLGLIPYVEQLLPLLDKIPFFLDKIGSGVDWVIQNWDKIGPAIEAVTVALVANKAATLALVAAQKTGMIIKGLTSAYHTASAALALLREGNSLAAVAQAVLNGTMLACPTTWIIAGITALGIAAYYLVKNWDKVSAFFTNLWNGPLNNKKVQAVLAMFMPLIGLPILIIKNWSKIAEFFTGLWEGALNSKIIQGVLAVFTPLINLPAAIIENWSKIAEFFTGLWDKIGGIFGKVGDFFGKVGGFLGIGVKTPQYATGTSFHPGGAAIVGERGRELLNLPRGSQVTPHNRTEEILRGLDSGGTRQTVSVKYAPQIVIQGNAGKREIEEASKAAFDDFERRFRSLLNENKRLSFAGG